MRRATRQAGPRRAVVGALAGGVAIVAFVAFATVSASAERDRPTIAPLEDGAPVHEDGSVDRAQLPGLVPVAGEVEDVVGYARSDDLFPKDGVAADVIPVWDPSGTDLLGHVYPDGTGFISIEDQQRLGLSPSRPPAPPSPPTTVVEE